MVTGLLVTGQVSRGDSDSRQRPGPPTVADISTGYRCLDGLPRPVLDHSSATLAVTGGKGQMRTVSCHPLAAVRRGRPGSVLDAPNTIALFATGRLVGDLGPGGSVSIGPMFGPAVGRTEWNTPQ